MAGAINWRNTALAGCLAGAALLAFNWPGDGSTRPMAANLASPKAAPAAKPAPPPPPPPPRPHGHTLVDLQRVERDGDRYVVDLGADGKAILTLDPVLQEAAEKTLARAKAPAGAIVVMQPDGRVLALAGLENGDATPTPAPDLATQVWAPAASIFKVITAAALVDAGVSPTKKVCYHGGLRSVTKANLVDNPKRDKRCQDLGYAVARSQNALIAKLAHKHLDTAALRDYADRFGMTDAPDFCASSQANRATIPETPLERARVSAGFWNTELSPLGGALVANVIASGGMEVTPYLIDSIESAQGVLSTPTRPQAKRAIPAEVAQKVGAMMVDTVARGTAYKGFHDKRHRRYMKDVAVAGKTGTLTRANPSYRQYSWFVGYAPADAPELVISVLLGNPAKWHLKAHTAARLVLDARY